MIRLIINADDFGLTESVNEAIIDVYKQGNLTSATLMVNMPGFEDAVSKASANPGLGVGLHFCITQGKALTGVSSLTNDNGMFFSRTQLLKKILKGRIRRDDIRNEFKAQIEQVIQKIGKITHTDSHQHIHMNPLVFFSILSVVRENEIRLRLIAPPMRTGLFMKRPLKAFKQLLLTILSACYKPFLQGRNNDYLVSVHESPDPLRVDENYYSGILENLPANCTVELMVHPYKLSSDLEMLYRTDWTAQQPFMQKCYHEYHLLSKKPLFSRSGLRLIRYDQV